MGTPATFPISTATFRADTYNFDPLLASEVISQSAKIAGSLGVLKRGTVLCGPAEGTPVTNATLLTTVITGAQARFILAADIDTTGGAVVGLVYSQGKFLDTAMIFTSQGAATDAAQLSQFGIWVLTVEQRSGLLVPMTGLPATGGPLPQAMGAKDAAKTLLEQVAAIKNADSGPAKLSYPPPPQKEPAWAMAAFGDAKPTHEQLAAEKTAIAADELVQRQQETLDKLEAEQAKVKSEVLQKQAEERAQFVKHHEPQPPAPPANDNPPANDRPDKPPDHKGIFKR